MAAADHDELVLTRVFTAPRGSCGVPIGTEMTIRQRVVPAAAAALPAVREHRRLAAQGWEQ